MKLLVVAACFVVAVLGAPKRAAIDPNLAAKRALQHEARDGRSQYVLTYSTDEGVQVHEKGRLVSTPDGRADYLQVEGETRYMGTDGNLYVTKYSAGLNGTHVKSTHVPVSTLPQSMPIVP